MWNEPRAWITIGTIADRTPCCEKSARSAIKALVSIGVLSKSPKPAGIKGGGRWMYTIDIERLEAEGNRYPLPQEAVPATASNEPLAVPGTVSTGNRYRYEPVPVTDKEEREEEKNNNHANRDDDFRSASEADREPWAIDDGLIRTACKVWRKTNGASSQSESTRRAFRLCVSNGAAHHGVTAPLDGSNALEGQQAAVRQIVWYAETMADTPPNFWPRFEDAIVGDGIWSNDLQQRAYAVMIERQSDAKIKSCLKFAMRSGRLIIRDGSEMDRLAAMIRSVQPDERMEFAKYIEAEGFETLAGLADGVRLGV